MSPKHASLIGWGTYVPDRFMTKEELAEKAQLPVEVVEEKLGVRKKPVPGPDDHCSTMALKAAQRAMERAAISPEDVDLVIWTGDEYKDYPLWTAGIKLKEDLGASNAWAYDLALRCGTTILALKVARDMIIADPDIRTVLLAGGYRNGDLIDYENPRVRFMYNLGAGASAAILREDAGYNQLLGSAFIDDGTLTTSVAVPAGGTREPLTPDGVEKKRHFLEVMEPEWMKERLEQVSMENFLGAIDLALERSSLSRRDIDYLALLHMKRSAHNYILEKLGLRQDQSVYLEDFGHIGQHDQIISLELGLIRGLVKKGSTVVMVSAGVGYAWNAQVINWG